MDQRDPEKRIAEPERRPVEANAAAAREDQVVAQPPQFSDAQAGAGQGSVDELARRYVQAFWDEAETGESPPGMLQLQKEFMRAAADAGMSQAQIQAKLDNELQRRKPRRQLSRENLIGWVIGVIGGVVAVVAPLTVVFPSSALWMSGIVCNSPHHLEDDTSHYSYGPNSQWSVSFQCVSDESWYEVHPFAIMGLQCLLVALVLGAVAAVGFLLWRQLRGRR